MIKNIKISICYLSIFLLLAPSVVQLVHSFEEHNHPVCRSKKVKHFHKHHTDCPILNFQLSAFNGSLSLAYDFFTEHFYPTIFVCEFGYIKSVYHFKKSSRAPPILV